MSDKEERGAGVSVTPEIEKVARALWPLLRDNANWVLTEGDTAGLTYDSLGPYQRGKLYSAALAAMEALMTPTEGMLDAVRGVQAFVNEREGYKPMARSEGERAWQAMLRSAMGR